MPELTHGLAQSADGKRLFVADSSLNAVAVFDTATLARARNLFSLAAGGPRLHPYRLVSERRGAVGDDLLIATAKGQSTGPNNGISNLKQEEDVATIPTFRRCCTDRFPA